MVGSQASADSNRLLYGGAITACIPLEFADVSQIREVPDNQEVFAHAETDRSVIIELLQMEHPLPEEHKHPAAYHMSVLAEDSGALEARLNQVQVLPTSDFPLITSGDRNASVSVAYATHLVSKFRDDKSRANYVNIYLACVRLPRATTDLLIVVNDPVFLHPESASTQLGSSVATPDNMDLSSRAQILKTALHTLQIKDWSLLL